MLTTKEEVTTLIERLPDNCTIEDVQYHLYFIEKVRKGLKTADAGRTLTQEQAEQRLSKWLVQ